MKRVMIQMILKLLTNDDLSMEVEKEDLLLSELIRTVVENLEEEIVEIPLPNVSFPILELIVQYTRYFRTETMPDIPHPLPSKALHEIVGSWYNDYIFSLSEDTLYQLIKAASYMDIEPIQELGCARLAIMIKGKQPDEVRRILCLEEE